MWINNKVVVITGGASGIGEATCRLFVQHNACVVIADIDGKKGLHLEKELNQHKKARVAIFQYCDVTKSDQIQESIDVAKKTFGSFDVMINNAGLSFPGFSFPGNIDKKKWEILVHVNLTAVLEGTQLAWKAMQENNEKGGVIINTASMGGLLPMPDSPVYSATKAGVVSFGRSLAYLAGQSNIYVCTICPSFVKTPLVTKYGKHILDMMEQTTGGVLAAEDVAKGMLKLVNEHPVGVVMRVTVQRGLDYWPKGQRLKQEKTQVLNAKL